jgi:hypothetical protein
MKSATSRWRSFVTIALSATVLFFACKKDDTTSPGQPRSKEYALGPVDSSGVTGKVIITENMDSSFNVLVALDKSVKDTIHIVQLRNGSISSQGGLALPLNSITGTGAAASSTTSNIKQVVLGDSTVKTMTYDSITAFNGYVNVYYSAAKMDSLIAHTNIGNNNN